MLLIFGTLVMNIAAYELQEPDCSIRYSIGALITKSDIVLRGHQKESIPSLTFIQCSLRCVKTDWCISINFEISERNGQCELNDYGVSNEFYVSVDSGEFEDRKGYIYSQLRPSQVRPKDNKGSTIDYSGCGIGVILKMGFGIKR
jgi:hypothetical protein